MESIDLFKIFPTSFLQPVSSFVERLKKKLFPTWKLFQISDISVPTQTVLNPGCYSTALQPVQESHIFPDIKDLAHLAAHSYKIYDLRNSFDPSKVHVGNNWKCIAGAVCRDGYCGGAYINSFGTHIVIAHGGTEFSPFKPIETWRDIKTDMQGVVLLNAVSQVSSALVFTQEIVNRYHDKVNSISVTGHSLGGWLAQICGLYIEFPEYLEQGDKNNQIKNGVEAKLELLNLSKTSVKYRLHVIGFESPGCDGMFREITGYSTLQYDPEQKRNWKNRIELLDITVIITNSNLVNTCNQQIGYLLKLDIPDLKDVSKISSHYMKNICDKLNSIEKVHLQEVYGTARWQKHSLGSQNIIISNWYVGPKNLCRMNIFPKEMIDFLSNVEVLLKWRESNKGITAKLDTFNSNENAQTRIILDKFKRQIEEVLNFTIQEDKISLMSCSDSNSIEVCLNLMKLLVKLKHWFKESNWHGPNLKEAIRSLPSCKLFLLQAESVKYLQCIPELNFCSLSSNHAHSNLCVRISEFLSNKSKRVLNIKTDRDINMRAAMIKTVHCVREFAKSWNLVEQKIFYFNIRSLDHLSGLIDCANMFLVHKDDIEVIVIECDGLSDIVVEILKNIIGLHTEQQLILVSEDFKALQVDDPRNLICTFGIDDHSISFSNLNDKSKDLFKRSQFSIQGDVLSLTQSSGEMQYLLEMSDTEPEFFESVDCTELICKIFGGEIITLVEEDLPVMADHYIPRKLYPLILDIKKINEAKDFTDMIVISDVNQGNFNVDLSKEFIIRPDPYTKNDFLNGTVEPDSNCVQFARPELLTKHWFKFNGTNLVWQMSDGPPCSQYLCHDKNNSIDENQMLNLENNFIILGDEPGMGKSAAIINLYLKSKSKNRCKELFTWSAYIDLNKHQVELRDPKTVNDVSLFNFLAKAMKVDSEVGKILLKYCIENEKQGNVSLSIDSFDEISEKGQSFVLDLFDYLKRKNGRNIKIWIATRAYAEAKIEKKLETVAYKFYRIEVSEQVEFLKNYWLSLTPDIRSEERQINRAGGFAKFVIEQINDVLGKQDNFIGIPLQLVLLAAIHSEGFKKFIEGESNDYEKFSKQFESTAELYEVFISKKLDIWLDEKYSLGTRSIWMDDKLKSEMLDIHSSAGFLYLTSSFDRPSTELGVYVDFENCLELSRAGICQTIVDWVLTICMPLAVCARIRKSKTMTFSVENYDSIVITLLDSGDKYANLSEKLAEQLDAKVFLRTEFDKSVSSDNIVVHWFKEKEESCIEWQKTSGVRFLNSSMNSVQLSISSHSFHFIHQTLAEYFTARYLKSQLPEHTQRIVEFLNVHYHLDYFNKVRYFLDSLLCKDIPPLMNLEILNTKYTVDVNYFQEIFAGHDWEREDLLGRNILHYASAYGNHEFGIFQMIMKNVEQFFKDDKMGANAFSYSFLAEYFKNNTLANVKQVLKLIVPARKDLISQDHLIIFSRFMGDEDSQIRHQFEITEGKVLFQIDFENMRRSYDIYMTYTNIPAVNEHEQLSSVTSKQNVVIKIDWLLSMNNPVGSAEFIGILYILNRKRNLEEADNYLYDLFELCLGREDGYTPAGLLNEKYFEERFNISIAKVHSRIVDKVCTNVSKYYNILITSDYWKLDGWAHILDTKGDEVKRQMLLVLRENKFITIYQSVFTCRHLEKLVGTAIELFPEWKDDIYSVLTRLFKLSVMCRSSDSCYYVWNFFRDDVNTRMKLIQQNFNQKPNTQPPDHLTSDDLEKIFDGRHGILELKSNEEIKGNEIEKLFLSDPGYDHNKY